MNVRTILTFGVSALVMGTTMVGCASTKGPLARASASADRIAANAGKEADAARKALGKRQTAEAVVHAEAAVAGDPNNAAHRALLGKAYLSAGRFQSASQALSDALTLAPGDGQVALNLALAQTALGDWDGARATLNRSAAIDAADKGLALALAGNPMGGIQLLGEAARDPRAPAKVRQNLALGLALAGKWQEAKAVAAIDLSPADVDKRIMQWSVFARPAQASDQVAALLHVTPVADQGQPMQLALNAPVASDVAVAEAEPLDAFMPGPVGEMASTAPVEVAVAAMAVTPDGTAVTRFVSTGEIVQPLPAGYVPANLRSAPVMVAATERARPVVSKPTGGTKASLERGSYFVQLGAYDSAGVARDAWGRMARRVPTLASLAPQGMSAGSFYRLSVGGFARGDANRLCGQVKARGGNCFVRTSAGEQTASWARGAQMASR
ncbi:SPOR domain-containing protein [Sphingomonas japonica]|uniref:Flp pilus assembly protein TadD n=1 Tax=Sphingomonas japonica TaxID=511662 RepID=A0ABX0U3M0_9SPHN|nr:SPOR domain-containing protein [Sphingomonas japonica]NIJ24334.1 Flp pilus assembly protein TadD [Sphingomonas japonica]